MKRTTQVPFELKISSEGPASSGTPFFISSIKALLFAFSAFCVSIPALAQPTGMGCNAGYQAEFPNYANFGPNTLIAFPIRIPSAGTLDSLAITHKFAGGNVVLALYQNIGGLPGSLVAASVAGSPTFEGTQQLDVPDTFVSEGDYFVAIIYSEAAIISYPALAASAMTTAYYKSNPYSMGFPQSFGPATSSTHLRINVWAITRGGETRAAAATRPRIARQLRPRRHGAWPRDCAATCWWRWTWAPTSRCAGAVSTPGWRARSSCAVRCNPRRRPASSGRCAPSAASTRPTGSNWRSSMA